MAMVSIPESTLEEIRSRISLEELISSYGIAVKSAGASKKACCPFHNEKTPSFNINESRGFYHCFGCGESGSAFTFVQKMEGLSFLEAVKKLAAQCGVKIEEKADPEAGLRARLFALMAEVAEFYHRCLGKIAEAELARNYLVTRALDEKTCADYLVGYAPMGMAPMVKWAEKHGYTPEELEKAGVVIAPKGAGDAGYHRFGGRLMFTIRDRQGRVVAFSGRQLVERKNSGKYVNSPETPIFKKSNVLFGFDRAQRAIAASPHREAIVCEGQIDCIRLHVSGFGNAVAGQGTAFTEEHVRMLARVADQVALVYDDDGAGHKATIKSARLCLAAGLPVRTVSLPGGDDPDSFLRRHPAADFQALLDGAQSIMSFQVRVERAAEPHPDSIDAVSRISRSLLQTIAACPNAVMRAGMLGEAAQLLGLPTAALQEELAKVKGAPVPVRRGVEQARDREEARRTAEELERTERELVAREIAAGEEVSGEDAAAQIPPPALEIAFCEFLLDNGFDKTLSGMAGEFLPPFVFAHAFTRRFVEVWRGQVATGEMRLAAFGDGLTGAEQAWYDEMIGHAGRSLASGLSPADILEDFVRGLWGERLRRVRGELPATGDAASEMARMRLTMDLKRLKMVRWNAVKEMVREWIADASGEASAAKGESEG